MRHCGRLWLWLAGSRFFPDAYAVVMVPGTLELNRRSGRKEMYHLLLSFVSAASQLWKATAYHPERHDMRGPGPKWREKHSIGLVKSTLPELICAGVVRFGSKFQAMSALPPKADFTGAVGLTASCQ